jgi:hypothetical protein
MAKVEGSNPFIRFRQNPLIYGGFVVSGAGGAQPNGPWVAVVGSKRRRKRSGLASDIGENHATGTASFSSSPGGTLRTYVWAHNLEAGLEFSLP